MPDPDSIIGSTNENQSTNNQTTHHQPEGSRDQLPTSSEKGLLKLLSSVIYKTHNRSTAFLKLIIKHNISTACLKCLPWYFYTVPPSLVLCKFPVICLMFVTFSFPQAPSKIQVHVAAFQFFDPLQISLSICFL